MQYGFFFCILLTINLFINIWSCPSRIVSIPRTYYIFPSTPTTLNFPTKNYVHCHHRRRCSIVTIDGAARRSEGSGEEGRDNGPRTSQICILLKYKLLQKIDCSRSVERLCARGINPSKTTKSRTHTFPGDSRFFAVAPLDLHKGKKYGWNVYFCCIKETGQPTVK